MDDENEIKLRPCPFCGGEAYCQLHKTDNLFDDIFVECKQCGAHLYTISVYRYADESFKKAAIVRSWNRRYNEKD